MSEIGGRYRLGNVLASGGAGVVYRAVDTHTSAPVAVKILRASEAGDEDLRHRFAREARAMRAVSHPNVVQCVDAGVSEEGLPYVVTEFVDGPTLHDVISQKGRLSEAEALRFTVQIAAALHAVHSAGIVHRDIKPENFVVAPDGELKLIDFGLSRIERGAVSWNTKAGTVLGSVHYVSPEQAQGRRTDERTDLWSAGAILFEMLSGHPPYSETSAVQTLIAIAEKPVPALRRSHAAEIVKRCLQKNPEERYASALELKHAAEAVLGHAQPFWDRVLRAFRR